MSNFSKIVIIILFLLSFFFIKENYGSKISEFMSNFENLPKFEFSQTDKNKNEVVKKPTITPNKKEETKEAVTVDVYFLALDKDDNGIYKKVTREVPMGQDKLEYAIKELLKGPNLVEKGLGAYSEIPSTTRLLKVKQKGNKVIVDFSSDFQYGGGTDSVYSRTMQLIKTSIHNAKNKKVYLYLDGEQVNILGGEGIMISQPLSENSLEM